MTKFWNMTCLRLVPSTNSCSHFFALAILYESSVWTTTRRTERASRIFQTLGSSLILVVGENLRTKALIWSLTKVGGVPLTSCSMISSHIPRLQEDALPQPSRSFNIVLTGAASSNLSICFYDSLCMSVRIVFASEINSNIDNKWESVHNKTIRTL